MTSNNLATVKPGVSQEDARRLLHQRRIEKLLVVDEDYRCVGLITVKDIEKAVNYPAATKDSSGRLRVAAASTVGDAGFARTMALVDAECDPIGSASRRERVCQYVSIAVVAVSLRTKKITNRHY